MQDLLAIVLRHFEDGASRAEQVVLGNTSGASLVALPAEDLPTGRPSNTAEWRRCQLQAYVFDTAACSAGGATLPAEQVERRRDLLAERLGCENYFDAYCWSRSLNPVALIGLADRHLATTKYEYRAQARYFLRAKYGSFHERQLQDRLALEVTADPDRYPFERTTAEIFSTLQNLGLRDKIDTSRRSRIGVTVNVAHPSLRKSSIFLSPAPGLESHRGALHALGHAIFSTVSQSIEDDLGVNIAATEAIAFQAQHLALADARESVGDFLRFVHLFQSRLYAIRALHDAKRLAKRSEDPEQLNALAREHLGIVDLKVRPIKSKLLSVDFLVAFDEFYRKGEIDPSWETLLSYAQQVTNATLVDGVNSKMTI
ncbi:hypothetical protein [uncultured Jatrophihabitans sp.]|uniref:hypothetical protein n=1 Tax=uncultured Jatrophihabitans sp. TaxID=1610747 RepID=UPI0035CA519B